MHRRLPSTPQRSSRPGAPGAAPRPVKRFLDTIARGPRSSSAHSRLAEEEEAGASRRSLLIAGLAGVLLAGGSSTPAPAAAAAAATAAADGPSISELQERAFEAYANREFGTTVELLNQIIAQEGENSQWFEMRAATLVDAKSFDAALQDYNKALGLTSARRPGGGGCGAGGPGAACCCRCRCRCRCRRRCRRWW
jgi:hypothetical protein